MFEIHQEFVFDAAHRFPGMPDGHQYRGVHGHSFRVTVTIAGAAQASGFVVDLGELEQACARLHDKLDHSYLNDIEGLETPSLERIAQWTWAQLQPLYPGLARVAVTRDSRRHGCTYFGPPDPLNPLNPSNPSIPSKP
jgi:6-pyruvoyltetrahydropterin/6-carboxytetrahydropterin synthase